MDSGGNSGSLLSSSEADEGNNSRAVVDSFISGHPVQPTPPSFFDPVPSYLQLHQSPIINWVGSSQPAPRSEPVPNEVVAKHHQLAPRPLAARNPRKRSRASRRALTTVLTTDTTNFRAMVQEFTGIPSPPFGGGSRFDLLGRLASTQSLPYLRRPFAQKIQSPLPFLTAAAPPSLFTSAVDSTGPNSSSDSIQIPQIDDYQLRQIPKTTPNQFAINPNQIFTSILESNPKFPIPPRSQASHSFNLIDDQLVSLGHDSTTLTRLPRWGGNPETPNAGGFSFRPSSELNVQWDKIPENDVVAVASREGVVGSSSPWICSSE